MTQPRTGVPSRRWTYWTVRAGVTVWITVSILLLAIKGIENFSYRGESGYGDGPIQNAIQLLSQTGRIYPAPTDSVTFGSMRAYGPLFFLIFYGFKVVVPSNWDLFAMRAAVIFAVLGGAVAVSQLAARAFSLPSLRWLVIANILSLQMIRPWITQLRGDFFAIALNGSALLILAAAPHAPLRSAMVAGIVAGLAPCIKLSYGTGCLTAVLWLLFWRQWRRVLVFGGAAGSTILLIHAITVWKEPQFLPQMMQFSRIFKADHSGQMLLLLDVFRDPLVICGFGAWIVMLAHWHRQRTSLLLIYAAVTGSFAFVSSSYVGANINYYFEFAMLLMAFASVGLIWLSRLDKRVDVSQVQLRILLVCGVVTTMIFFAVPLLFNGVRDAAASRGRVVLKNHRFEELHQLRSLRILSFSPDATMATGTALIDDPWGFSALSRQGVINVAPLRSRVEDGYFDLVIVDREHVGWRGVPTVDPALVPAIQQHYVRQCEISGIVLFRRKLPDPARDSQVRESVQRIDCR